MPLVNPTNPGTAFTTVNLFSDVRALAAGAFPAVNVLGGTAIGDGKDGTFYWSSNSSASDDSLTVLAPNVGGTGRWVRLYSGFALSSGASHVGYLPGFGALSGIAQTVSGFLDKLGQAGASLGASLVGFLQSDTGALARPVSQVLAAEVRSGDFDTIANYKTAHAALTERIGVAQLDTTVIDTGSSTAGITFKVNGTTQFKVLDLPGAVNYWTVQGDTGTGGPRLAAEGASIDIHMVLCSKGTGPVIFCTGGASSLTQLEVVHTANAGNVLDVTGCTSLNAHGVQITGAQKTSGDAAVNLGINTLGVGKVCFESNALLIGTVQVPTVANTAHVTIGPTFGLTTGIAQSGISLTAVGNSDATSTLTGVDITARTASAAFTCGTVQGIRINDAIKGSTSAITTQEGIRVADLTVGSTNIAYRGLVSSGSSKFNCHMGGTADNFFEGKIQFGATGIAANNAQTVTVGNVGPAGAGIAILEWASVKNASGTTRYMPLFG